MSEMISSASHKWLENQTIRAFNPAIEILGPAYSDCGIIAASPHSGRIYPKSFFRAVMSMSTAPPMKLK